MQTNFKRPFAQYVKKAHKPLRLAIEDEVEVVCEAPEVGELKVGDLAARVRHQIAIFCVPTPPRCCKSMT